MRDIPLRGHKNTRCTETWCYCYDEDFGDPMCSCGNVAFSCNCDGWYNEDEEPCMGEGCLNPHPDHTLAECYTLEMCEANEGTMIDLDKLESMLSVATPGPWVLHNDQTHLGPECVDFAQHSIRHGDERLWVDGGSKRLDMALVAEVHNALPKLISEARECARLRAEIEHIKRTWSPCRVDGDPGQEHRND